MCDNTDKEHESREGQRRQGAAEGDGKGPGKPRECVQSLPPPKTETHRTGRTALGYRPREPCKGKRNMGVKQVFRLKHCVVMLLLSYEGKAAKYGIGPSTAGMQNLLRERFGMTRSRNQIRTVMRQLQADGIIQKEERSTLVPPEISKVISQHFHVIDAPKQFEDIQTIYNERHRLRDMLRKQRQRRRNKAMLRAVRTDEEAAAKARRAIREHKTPTARRIADDEEPDSGHTDTGSSADR